MEPQSRPFKNLTKKVLDSIGILPESKGNQLGLRSLALDPSKNPVESRGFFGQFFEKSRLWIQDTFFPVYKATIK